MPVLAAPQDAPHGALHLGVADARAHLKDVLDASDAAFVPTISRDGKAHAVIQADLLLQVLRGGLHAEAKVGQESDYWYVMLPKWNLQVSAPSLGEALDDMVEELREYAADWHDELRAYPNHRDNAALVALLDLSEDADIRAWLEA